MLKRTTEDVKKYFAEQGCELFDEYLGCQVIMRYRCKCGREAHTVWNNFSRGKRCGYCHVTGRKKKWVIEELQKLYEPHGCKLLEEEYINSKVPLRFRCRCGQEDVRLLHEFVKQPRCWDCYIASRSGENHHAWVDGRSLVNKDKPKRELIDAGYVTNFFKSQRCTLLSEYKGSAEPLSYVCKCGREATTVWSNFLQGKRCGRCGSKRAVKFTLEEVKQLFVDEGCEFLDENYVNNTTSHRFRCSCGEEGTIKVQYFQRGVRCAKCKKAKRSGPNHFAWRHDRDQFVLDIKFRKRVYGFLARCRRKFNTPKEGHADEVLGYTPRQLQEHIVNHPNWERVKNQDWHLDHIFPLEAFFEHEVFDFRIINALDNLQPILQTENNQKKDKYDRDAFLEWLSRKT
jgi:hypothetical protein